MFDTMKKFRNMANNNNSKGDMMKMMQMMGGTKPGHRRPVGFPGHTGMGSAGGGGGNASSAFPPELLQHLGQFQGSTQGMSGITGSNTESKIGNGDEQSAVPKRGKKTRKPVKSR